MIVSAETTTTENQIPTYKIHHRFLSHPSPDTPLPFQHLGNLKIYETSNTFTTSLEEEEASSSQSNSNGGTVNTDDGKGWYQIGIQLNEFDIQNEWLFSSTKSCYLSTSTPKIKIHLSSSSSIPSSLSIQPSLSSINACSTNSTTSVKLPSNINELNFDFLKSIPKTFSPSLAPPPVVDPTTGTPAPPEVEKTFFQKYWMAIVGIALFFAMQMGPDEPKNGAPAAAAK
ncbi:uncharacterized protein L201_004526 [Kwoniella dendrophila CBS 6074]|uniref:ER membrane protein complex subunit 10 n=1 Tax=Kwoniella dendrophila CBS 6074 TaxID=1295534 RepID=A0AAX4JWF9_9TREE